MIPRATLAAVLILSGLATGDAVAQATPSPALLVGEKDGALLTIVDPATLRVVERVPANPNPHEVATDGRYAYVSNSGRGAITVVDLRTRRPAPPIELGALGAVHGLWMSGGKLYFANEAARTLGRYDPAAGKIDWVLGTGQPQSHMLVVSPDGNRIFTANTGPGTVSVIEREPGAEWAITVVPTGRGAEGLDLSPDGAELWVANVRERTLSIVDVAGKRVVETVPLPTAYSNRLKFTPDGRHVLVADLRGSELLVFDARTRREVKRIDFGGGTEGLLMTPDGSRAFVAVSARDRVAVVDLRTLTVIGEIPGLRNPDGMAWAEAP